MGLGKTIQTVAFMQVLKTYQKVRGPFLIIAPLSTLINWQRELQLWSEMDVVLYYGSSMELSLIRDHEFLYFNASYTGKFKVEVVVTTLEIALLPDVDGTMEKDQMSKVRRKRARCRRYEGVGSDAKGTKERMLSSIQWELIVIDQAHKLKKYEPIREEYKFSNLVLLPGTPLQNNVDELWALLNFIDKDKFDDLTTFCERYSSLKEVEQLDELHQQLKPYFLRREKEIGILLY